MKFGKTINLYTKKGIQMHLLRGAGKIIKNGHNTMVVPVFDSDKLQFIGDAGGRGGDAFEKLLQKFLELFKTFKIVFI